MFGVFRRIAAILSAAIVSVSNVANAAPLSVGEAVAPLLVAGTLSGSLVAGPLWTRFSSPAISGLLKSVVLTNDPTNPFGADKLTFAYAPGHGTSSLNGIERLTIGSVADTQLDVTTRWQALVGGNATPVLVERSTADVISITYHTDGRGPTIWPGTESKWLVVHTDATEFAPSFGSVFGGSVVTVETFAPLPAIPEPRALVLASIGVIGSIGLLWRARKRRQPCFHLRGAARAV